MSRAVSLGTLRARVRKEADAGPDTTTGRHTNSEINTMINGSWQAMRETITQAGDDLYLKATTPTTMTIGPLSGYSFGTVPYPSDCAVVHGIDVTIAANDVRSLPPGSWKDRNEYRDAFGGATGTPLAFAIYNIGTESGVSVTAGKIAIFPAPDRAYTYSIWYIPSWTDISSDTDVFDGVAGWDDWVVWDSVLKIAAPDNDRQQCAGIAIQMKAEAEKRMLGRAHSLQRVGPSTRRVDMERRAREARNWSMFRRP